MLARVCSAALNGIDAYPIEVEVNAGYGDTLVVIVGLPDAAVKESRDRVSTALTNSGYKFPMGKTTINLAPADVKKEGPSFDLPIAIGMLAASEQIETDQLDYFVITGELALTGAVRPGKGILPIALRAKADGKTGMLVPAENAAEAAVVARLASHSGPKSPRGRAISRRRNKNRAGESGHRENFSSTSTMTTAILPKSKARKT